MTLQKAEVLGVQWVGKKEMLAFVDKMDYRPENYRRVIREYIEDCIEEKGE